MTGVSPEWSGLTPAVTGPYAITQRRNFGASGRRGTLAMSAKSVSAVTRAVWAQLDAHLQGSDLADRRSVLFCSELGDIAEPNTDSIIVAHRGLAGAHPQGFEHIRWISANLGDAAVLGEVEEKLRAEGNPCFLVVGGVLEQLQDPRPLLRMLRRILKCDPRNIMVIGSLDRVRLETAGLDGRCWQRLWTAEEFAGFLAASGFQQVSNGVTGTENYVVVSKVRCTLAHHAAFLRDHGLPAQASRLVLISSDFENPETDNIEQWIAESERLAPAIVMSMGGPFNSSRARTALRVCNFAEWENAWISPEAALEAVLHVVYLYDELERIEYQDYGGCFCRISQAKRAGLLPTTVTSVVICHGSNFYVERVNRQFQPPQQSLTHLWEKITIELAECAVLPSEYMRWLVLDQLRLRPLGSVEVCRLPYAVRFDGACPDAGVIDTIVFLGNRGWTGGWSEFLEAVTALLGSIADACSTGIRRVVVLGTKADGTPFAPIHGIPVERITTSIEALPEALRAVAAGSVVVVPWSGSGQAYPLLLAVDAGCHILAMQAGGIEELVPATYRELVLCGASASALHRGLQLALTLSTDGRAALVAGLREAMRKDVEAMNASWSALHLERAEIPSLSVLPGRPSPVSVVVPVYNRPYGEIEDLIVGLNGQILKPAEVIFVDDASREDFAAMYGDRIRSSLHMPVRFIRHHSNKGLAGARNTGLFATATEFIAVHDSDNIATNDFLYRGCLTLLANPDIHAATFLLQSFTDGEDWSTYDARRDRYHPVGDGLVESLAHINWLGDAMAVYRVSTLRELGGWDESDHAMWEDLALFLHMLAANRRIMNVPSYDVLYRIRPDSMLRTYSEFAARQRMARYVYGLTPFDALSLQRIILAQMKGAPAAPSVRDLVFAGARQYVSDKPRLRRAARLALKLARRSGLTWAVPR